MCYHLFKNLKKQFKPYKQNLKFGHTNARSIPKSIDEISHTICEADLDALAVSESWLNKNLPGSLFEINGYTILRKDRTTKRAGGVCFYVKEHLSLK